MKRRANGGDYLEPYPKQVQKPAPIDSPARVPPEDEWRENPELAFGIRVRANLAIPAVWPM